VTEATVKATLILAIGLALLQASTSRGHDVVQVTDDGYLNYMPSLIERADGSLMIAYERLDASFESGDILVTTSDDGASWEAPTTVVAGPGNERHPALVQMLDGSYHLYYLSDETGGYRIHRAASPDGETWTPAGLVDLGWTSEHLVNPTVCREADGSLTMAYDWLSNGGYVAHSEDGITWDHDRTYVSGGSLNRIARHSDGTYSLSYQKRTGAQYWQIDIFTRVSPDRVSWSPEERVTTNLNSHDSYPVELSDGQYALYYAKSVGGSPYDLYSVVSDDGASWHSEENWLPYAGWDTQPHPVRLSSGLIAIAWARGPVQTDTEVHFALVEPPTLAPETGTEADLILSLSPNPFRDRLEIRAAATGASTVSICDVAGRVVRSFEPAPGGERLVWNGTDAAGHPVAAGIYFVRASTPGGPAFAKAVLLR
jgi:hypothetical protein